MKTTWTAIAFLAILLGATNAIWSARYNSLSGVVDRLINLEESQGRVFANHNDTLKSIIKTQKAHNGILEEHTRALAPRHQTAGIQTP